MQHYRQHDPLGSAHNGTRRYKYGAIAALFMSLTGTAPATAATVTACTSIGLCYCINSSKQTLIEANVSAIRQSIADRKTRGKAIGYLSIPLSTVGGGYYGVNSDVAAATKTTIENALGQGAVWLLNPAAAGNIPGGSGADYMYMWTSVLAGRSGLGENFDFFYFVGPSDFRKFFARSKLADLDAIDAYFDDRLQRDPDFANAVTQHKVSKQSFRDYYGLRASIAFSLGSHDEWNIARLINERRRGSANYGIPGQLGLMFDGHAVLPGAFDTPMASGDEGRCIN